MADPKGYYAILGVDPACSAETIKRAYRELAKKYHPDAQTGGSSARFRAINEAYVALSDKDSRAKYDSMSQNEHPAAPEAETLNPICCSVCRRATAQPRHLRFWKVYSAFIVTVRVPVQGIYCAECAEKTALGATFFSGLLGWWGFPWGPIYTVSTAIENLRGGVGSLASDEAMLWYNAVAFHSLGNDRLAYGLALKVEHARDEKVAANATSLLRLLERRGIIPETAQLKNPWTRRTWAPLKQIAALFFLPAIIFGCAYASNKQTMNAPYNPPQYTPAVASAEANVGVPRYARPIAPANVAKAHCWFTPTNGQVLSVTGASKDVFNKLIIENGSEGNAVIKVKGLTRAFSLKFYVAERMTAEFDKIPDGQYEISYSSGTLLGDSCKGFDPPDSVNKFDGVESFQTEYTADSKITHSLTYTLFTVRGGNAHAENISLSDFDAD